MKCVFITFNQVLNDDVLRILNNLQIRGFTKMQSLQGRGSETGDPHMGSHSWPALNGGLITITTKDKARELLKEVKELNKTAEAQGIRAFMWDVEESV